MKKLRIKPAADCRYDLVSLGEVMLRFDPGIERIRNADSFKVWEGGGEYNVAKNLSSCFKQHTAVITALVDNEIGRLVEGRIRSGGVDTRWIKWMDFDGIGASARNGLYFMERGFGIRGAQGLFDRGNSAVSQLTAGDINWEELFGVDGVRWFHTGGIFAGLSETTPSVVEEAICVARKHGTVVSYDPNFRAALWDQRGGKEQSETVNHAFLQQADVMFTGGPLYKDIESWEETLRDVAVKYPNLSLVAATGREVRSATRNDWGAACFSEKGFQKATEWMDLEIYDRVGAGDAFAAGVIFGLMKNESYETALQYGITLGALTMTTPGDTSMVSRAEVENVMSGQSGEIRR